jgi:hypothetical protein
MPCFVNLGKDGSDAHNAPHSVENGSCGLGRIFFQVAPRNDLQGVVWQRSLKCLRLVPRRAHPDVVLSSVVRITGIAFGWIGSTIEFGVVVRKP